jgi:hypothetical protein
MTTHTVDTVAAHLAELNAESGITAADWVAGVAYHAARNRDTGMVHAATVAAHDAFVDASQRVTELQGVRGERAWDSICARAVVGFGLAPDPIAGLSGADVRGLFAASVAI